MKVLMYETKSTGCGKITGMFECDDFGKINSYDTNSNNMITAIFSYWGKGISFSLESPCLTEEEFLKYKGDKDVWAWKVKNPERFDKLVELYDLYKPDILTRKAYIKEYKEDDYEEGYLNYCMVREDHIDCAPQSWKYAIYNGELVVLLSIHHKYAELIYSGEKTVEIRKSYPRKGNK